MNHSADDIFLDALDLPPDKRGDFLDQACSGDAGLRQAVDAMLLDAALADTYFEAPAVGIPTAAANGYTGECPGDRIGPYTLREHLGEGGFGIVWLAEQHKPLARRVAIKVIKPGMDTRFTPLFRIHDIFRVS